MSYISIRRGGWPAKRGPRGCPRVPGERGEWVERERRMLQQARHVFTMAGPAAASLRTSYGLPEERVTVVGGGVNFDVLPALGESLRTEPVILFVGRDAPRKGCDVLVSAFRLVRERVPAARLQVIGTHAVPGGPGDRGARARREARRGRGIPARGRLLPAVTLRALRARAARGDGVRTAVRRDDGRRNSGDHR